jgi:hypothetical protein
MNLKAKFVSSIGLLSLLCLLLAPSLWADDFTFSFTNTVGNVPGTVTGEILGLTNSATGAAAHVIINSYPDILPYVDPDLALLPADLVSPPFTVNFSLFTESSGAITTYSFQALAPQTTFTLSSSGSYLLFTLPGTSVETISPVTFTPLVSAVPEPGTFALMLTGVGLLVAMLRNQIAKVLPQAT